MKYASWFFRNFSPHVQFLSLRWTHLCFHPVENVKCGRNSASNVLPVINCRLAVSPSNSPLSFLHFPLNHTTSCTQWQEVHWTLHLYCRCLDHPVQQKDGFLSESIVHAEINLFNHCSVVTVWVEGHLTNARYESHV